METLSRDEFYHKENVENLLKEMQVGVEWGKQELIKQIGEQILNLPTFVITVERQA